MKAKKILLTVFSVLTILAVTSFVACSKEEPKERNTLDFAQSESSFVIGESRYLTAVYSGETEETVTYACDNSAVLAITEDGLCTGISVGTANVKASAGDLEATIKVSVGLGDAIPTLAFDNCNDGDALNVGLTDGYDLSAKIRFNGATYEDAKLSYSQKPVLGTITNGAFRPAEVGSTEITVTAEWRNCGVDLTATVTITVRNEIEIYVNDNVESGSGEIELYSMKNFCGKTYRTETAFVPYAFENGKQIEAKCEIKSGGSVVKYDETENKITALGYGDAEIKVFCTDASGIEHERIYKVNVKVPVGDYEGEIPFSAYDGDLPVEDIFGVGETILKAYTEDGESLTVADNKVKGIRAENLPAVVKVTVSTNKCGYTLTLKVYTRIIKKAEDLSIFRINGKVGEFNGYYLLANDIDATGYTCSTGADYDLSAQSNRWFATAGYGACGLKGTFDGNGHSISNLTVGQFGIFGVINGGTVKNVALKDLKYTSQSNIATLAWYVLDAKIENVYMNAETLPAVWARAMVASSIYQSSMNNVVIKLGDVLGNTGEKLNVYDPSMSAYGSLVSSRADFSDKTTKANEFKDVYVISATKLSVLSSSTFDGENKTDANRYVGVKRYDTEEEMISASEDYASFIKSGYWNISSGIPVFGK